MGRNVGYPDGDCQHPTRYQHLRFVGYSNTLSAAMAHNDHMADLKMIGGRIRKLRLAAKLSQPELAAALGLSSRSTIAGIETGADRAGIETMVAIADYFKVPMDWLLGRTVPPGSPPVGKLINRDDEIAVIDFWHSLSVDQKKAVVTTLRIPLYIPNNDTAA